MRSLVISVDQSVTVLAKSSIGVLLLRLFFEMSPSARTSKGFRIVGTSVAPASEKVKQTICSNRRFACTSA